MFKLYFTQTSQTFVWLFGLYGGSLGSHLTIALQNKVFKISQTWVGSFKGMPVVFISDFDFSVDRRHAKEEDREMRVCSTKVKM